MRHLLLVLSALILSSCYSPKRIAKKVDDSEKAEQTIALLVKKFPSLVNERVDTIRVVVPNIEYRDTTILEVDSVYLDSVLANIILDENTTVQEKARLSAKKAINSFIGTLNDNGVFAPIDTNGVVLHFNVENVGGKWVVTRSLDVKERVINTPVNDEDIIVNQQDKEPFYNNFWFYTSLVLLLAVVLIIFILRSLSTRN